MNKIIVTLLLSILCLSISSDVFAQNNNWNYMGKVYAHYGNGDGYKTENSVLAELYSSFDGEKISYRLIVGGEVFIAYKNEDFSQSRYDDYMRRSQDDHFHGVGLKNKEKYPYRAGKYRFNPAQAYK